MLLIVVQPKYRETAMTRMVSSCPHRREGIRISRGVN
jgi:hypothetical protein